VTAETLLRTPLYQEHVAAGAKIVPFAGFEMPVQYPTGITVEHTAVRSAGGLFDVSHMGEFFIRGPQALDLVQYVTSNDASTLVPGQAQYSTLLRENGTVVDDLLVYRLTDGFMLVVNGANRQKDFDWISRFVPRFEATLEDRSDEIALIALQGPVAAEVLAPLVSGVELDAIRYYHFADASVEGVPVMLSRTGYTGEDGFEIYLPNEHAVGIWRAILEAGRERGVVPAGLGARDSLRLEMGYPLYGNELDDTRTPYDAGLGWIVKLDKGETVASEALRQRRAEGTREKLVGFVLLERGFPRHGYPISQEGQETGVVTSGTLSPTLGKGIGLGYLPADSAKTGGQIGIVVRGQPISAEIVRPPFHKAGSIRG
jgi:aminomethyltransferase